MTYRLDDSDQQTEDETRTLTIPFEAGEFKYDRYNKTWSALMSV